MATIVQLKRSSVSGKQPDAANIQVGEPVVNLADQVVYTKTGSNAIVVIGAGTTSNISEGVNLYYTNARAISAFTAGNNITIAANGLISANVSGGGGSSVTVANVAPMSASEGDLYFDNELLTLFVYYDDGNTQQWVEATPASSNNPFEFSKSVSGSETELFRFSSNLYRAAKFTITLNDSPNFKIEEVSLIHNGTDVSISQPYMSDGQAFLGSVSVNYSANITDGNVLFNATALTGSPVAKGIASLIRI